MIQVKVDAVKYGNIFFDIFTHSLKGTCFYFKANMLKYENNLTYYGTEGGNYLNEFYYNKDFNFDFIKNDMVKLFEEREFFIFDFDNEEEAFYFKMKYG